MPLMLDYNQQEAKYLWLIDRLKNYNFETNIVTKITEWDVKKGVIGFPNTYSLHIEYIDAPKSNMDLIFYLGKDGAWNKVEILNIDIAESYRFQGFGRKLINHAINIAKVVGAKTIFGDVLDNLDNNYSSAGFYKKCGFEICEDSKPRRFHMDLNI